MNQVISLLVQAGTWIFADSRRVQALLAISRATQNYYRTLSPEKKAQVDAIILWAGTQLVKHTLPDVLGDVAHRVIATGASEKVAEFAQAVVTRGAEIGIEKAIEEAKHA